MAPPSVASPEQLTAPCRWTTPVGSIQKPGWRAKPGAPVHLVAPTQLFSVTLWTASVGARSALVTAPSAILPLVTASGAIWGPG